jgi:hypothetical protein
MSSQTQERIARELGIDRQLARGDEAAEIVRRVAFIQQVCASPAARPWCWASVAASIP